MKNFPIPTVTESKQGLGMRFRSSYLGVLAFLAIAPCLAQGETQMDQIIQSYVANNQFMGAVLVARGDQVLLSKGYGFANLEWNIPNTPETKFRLGSLTKQFTAASVLILEERENFEPTTLSANIYRMCRNRGARSRSFIC